MPLLIGQLQTEMGETHGKGRLARESNRRRLGIISPCRVSKKDLSKSALDRPDQYRSLIGHSTIRGEEMD